MARCRARWRGGCDHRARGARRAVGGGRLVGPDRAADPRRLAEPARVAPPAQGCPQVPGAGDTRSATVRGDQRDASVVAVVYFDSSAFVKLVMEEVGTDVAVALWDGTDAAVSSRIAYPEVCAALAFAERAGRLTARSF